jgi:DAK2 domain fusion protein YloV
MEALDLAVVRRFADLAVDALAGHREEIDALNVYPVPDGDTGTNLYLTVVAGRDAIEEAHPADGATAVLAFARGALVGARGNSGVILAEMLATAMRRLARASADERRALVLAEALVEASAASYAAVGTPVEGTMLTVCRVAAEAAGRQAGDESARSRDVLAAAAQAAREALDATPGQLDRLAQAGVVDAGGRGVSVLFDAVETALTGRRQAEAAVRVAPTTQQRHADLTADGPSYEVMYLLDADGDTTEETIAGLRETLGGLGDSLVMVGGDGLWNVHVHVDDVGAAIEAGIAAGRPRRIRVTHFVEQVHADQREAAGRAVVAVAAGPGLSELFAQAGAVVVEGRPVTRQLVEAIVGSGAAEVIVLPNDHASLRVAEAAARTAEQDADLRVAVIPSVAQVQGLAALAVHEPTAPFDRDVLEMTATARHARHGAVTIADRRALTLAGPCEPGDVLGVIDGDFIRVGDDVQEVALDVLARLVGGGGEMVTLVSGYDDADGALAAAATAWVEQHHPTIDVVTYVGGQVRYPLLVAVE